jgi:tRNA 2-thiocytidine biosynthesis protein TtcA
MTDRLPAASFHGAPRSSGSFRGLPERLGLSPADAQLLERFSHHVGRGISRFSMIGPGDRVLIGVSGGKDSLALSLALTVRRRWVPVDYELFAVHVEWDEYPMTAAERDSIDAFFDLIELPLRRVRAGIAPPTFRQKFSCYTCSRNRKRILFEEARRVDARLIALGHHMDDIARTTLMNMFFHGEFATMMPVQPFFSGALSIIRPMCEVREAEIARVARRLGIPSVPNRCPNSHANRRALMKDILRLATQVDRHAASNVYGSAWRRNEAYLPAREPVDPSAHGAGEQDRGEPEDNPEQWL